MYIALHFGKNAIYLFSDFAQQLDKISDKGRIQVYFDVLFLSRLLDGVWMAEGAYHPERLELKKSMTTLLNQYKSKVYKSLSSF